MDGTFELNKPGWYTPKLVTENEFLNSKLESDMYGIYYSVLFEGDAETYLLQAKKAPVEGVKEWGHIAESKSGKSMRFKRDKQEEGHSQPSPASKSDKPYLRDVTAIPLDVWRTLVGIQGVPTNQTEFTKFFQTVQEHANELLLLIDNVRSGSQETVVPTTHAQPIKAGIVTPATRTSLGDEYRGRNEPEYSESDMPEES